VAVLERWITKQPPRRRPPGPLDFDPASRCRGSMKSEPSGDDRFVVIMAGGRGERFWPLSRERTPKQLLKLLGNRSFLQQAVDRVRPLVPAEHVFVISNATQAREVKDQLPELPPENVVAEPAGRDTCAAVALGAALVASRSATGVMAVLPADHVIPDAAAFRQVLADAFDLAGRGATIVTIGIEPTEPATGYGYIRLGEALPGGEGDYGTVFHRAERFVEKPPHETAVEYLENGGYRWNAGMFIWSGGTIAEALQEHRPDMSAACRRWTAVGRDAGVLAARLAADYPALEKISIDYAVMERARNVVVADGAFAWDDLGSWTALARHLPADADGNCTVGDFVQVDSAGNLIYDARTAGRTPIAAVGLRDTIVVHTDDAVLLVHKSEAQKVKELVKRLAADDVLKKLV
jgi:mannose-1-phosphate guanylyltransferase